MEILNYANTGITNNWKKYSIRFEINIKWAVSQLRQKSFHFFQDNLCPENKFFGQLQTSAVQNLMVTKQ